MQQQSHHHLPYFLNYETSLPISNSCTILSIKQILLMYNRAQRNRIPNNNENQLTEERRSTGKLR